MIVKQQVYFLKLGWDVDLISDMCTTEFQVCQGMMSKKQFPGQWEMNRKQVFLKQRVMIEWGLIWGLDYTMICKLGVSLNLQFAQKEIAL